MPDTREPGLAIQMLLNERWNVMRLKLPPEAQGTCNLAWLGACLSQAVLIAAYRHGLQEDEPAQRAAMQAVHDALHEHFPLPSVSVKEVPRPEHN